MEKSVKYLNGDVEWLQNVNKIVSRKFELPLMLKSRIQIRKNMFGIEERLLKSMNSYGTKFRYIEPELKQPIRSLRPRSKSHPEFQPFVNSKSNRSLLEKSSEWKLPPNIYNLSDIPKSQAGNKGPYQCFTVKRDEKTIKNHFSGTKSEKDCCKTDFYELSSSSTFKCSPNNKFKFLKSPRFKTNDFAQNTCLLKKKLSKKNILRKKTNQTFLNDNPVFFYPLTTVPIKEMSFNKEKFLGPDPSRYNNKVASPHSLKNSNKKTFHDNLNSDEREEIRYNTMVKKRNVFGLKTGRPAVFLSASPRFKDEREKSIQLYENSKKKLYPTSEINESRSQSRLSKKRLEQLATPKIVLQKISVQKIQVFTKNPLSKGTSNKKEKNINEK